MSERVTGQHPPTTGTPDTEWPTAAYGEYFAAAPEPIVHRDYGRGQLFELSDNLFAIYPTAHIVEVLPDNQDVVVCKHVGTAPTVQPEGVVIDEATRFLAVNRSGNVTYQLIHDQPATAPAQPTGEPAPATPQADQSPAPVDASQAAATPSRGNGRTKQPQITVTGVIEGEINPSKTIRNRSRNLTHEVSEFKIRQEEPPILWHVTVYPGDNGGSLKHFQGQVARGEVYPGATVQLQGYDKGHWKDRRSGQPLPHEKVLNATKATPLAHP
jgi:hypothetical protein